MDDRRPTLRAVISCFLIFSIFAVCTRLYVRKFIVRLVGWDDILITAAMLLILGLSSTQLASIRFGLGLHVTDVPPENIPKLLLLLLVSGFAFNLAHMVVKLAYLAFYLRIATLEQHRLILYICIGIVLATGLSCAPVYLAFCRPIQKNWQPDFPGTCIDVQAFVLTISVLNMVFDIVIFMLPIPTLWELKRPVRQRLILAATFAAGLIILAASVVRLKILTMISYLKDQDPTWSNTDIVIWSDVEIHLAIILSCTPAFKTLIQAIWPNLFGKLSLKAHITRKAMGDLRGEDTLLALQSPGAVNLASVSSSGVRTVIESRPRDAEGCDSRERIATGDPRWLQMETTISIRSAST